MQIENGPSTFPTVQSAGSDSTGFAPAQSTGGTPTIDTGLPQLTDTQKAILPRYRDHIERNGDQAGDFAVTKLNAQIGGTGTDSDGGTAQPPATLGIMSGLGPKGEMPLLNDPQALARRQAREADSRNNTYGESDPSSGGTQALTRTPDPESLRMKNSRLLTEEEKKWLREEYDIAGTVDLNQIRVHEDERDKPFYVPKDMNGMTQENHVYIQTTRDK